MKKITKVICNLFEVTESNLEKTQQEPWSSITKRIKHLQWTRSFMQKKTCAIYTYCFGNQMPEFVICGFRSYENQLW